MTAFTSYVPGPTNLLALAAILLTVAAFIGIGRLLNRGDTPPEVLLISGWAATIIVATVFGVLTPWPLVWVLYPLLALGLSGWFGARLWRSDAAGDTGRLLAVGAPVLLVVAAASASQWDEFAHWLVNQRYLFEVGTFPRRGLPESTTIFAAYPYGLPIVGFMASRVLNIFVENAGALLNTLLILALGSAAVRTFRIMAEGGNGPLTWAQCALGFLVATALNPTFVPKLTFTTYADWSTAVVLGVALASGWRMIESSVTGRDEEARAAALQVGLAAALLVSLKQPNVILVLLLYAGLLIGSATAWRSHSAGAIALALRVLIPPLIVFAAWRYHVSMHLAGREFSFLPWDKWLWDDLGTIALRMLLIASKKGGYFGLMLVATGAAMWAFVRVLRGKALSPLGRLAVVVATVFVGYNGFLFVAYVGAFGTGEGLNAASYWRYNTQLGGAALIFAAAAAGELSRRRPVIMPHSARATVLVVALLLPVVLAPKIRFDLNPVTRYVRSVGVDIGSSLQAGSRLLVIDPMDNGKRAMLLHYETYRAARVVRFPESVDSPDAIRRAMAAFQDAYVWIHVPTPVLAQAFAQEMAPGSSYLLAPGTAGWSLSKAWPYPGYTDPVAEDD